MPNINENQAISDWSKVTQQVSGSGEGENKVPALSFAQTTRSHFKSTFGDERYNINVRY